MKTELPATLPARPRAVSAAAMVLAFYTFLLVGRIPEIFSVLAPFRTILLTALVASALALTLPSLPGGSLFRIREVRGMIVLYGAALLAVPLSVWPGGAFEFAVFQMSKTVLYFLLVVYCVRTLPEAQRVLWGVLWAILTLEIGVFLFNVQERAYVTGTYDPNDIAFIMGCALPLAVFLRVDRAPWRRYLGSAIVLLAIVVIIKTQSRGGFIGLAAVGAILLVRLPSRNMLQRVAVTVLAVLTFTIFASDAYWDRMSTIWGGGDTSDPTNYDAGGFRAARWNVWMTGVDIMLANPWGVGGGQYQTAEGQTHGPGIKWDTVHNSFLEVGAELGILGLAAFIFLLVRAVKNCRSIVRDARQNPALRPFVQIAQGVEIALYAYCVGGMSLSQGYLPLAYLLVALSVVLRRMATEAAASAPVAAPEVFAR